MGGSIDGSGTPTVIIKGKTLLGGAVHTVMPDRIEFGTLACAAAITGGELLLRHARADLLGAGRSLLEAAGIALREVDEGVVATRSSGTPHGIDFTTGPYPGFATDLQAPVMAHLATAVGASTITETVFEQRFRHVDELRKLGANIVVRGRTALIRGVDRLNGAAVICSDVRAAAALVIAGLGASGETVVTGLDHLDRGYEQMAERLAACGADLVRSD
jgi:UDP-N-acetylglucosamine 1-carboxyvinyltransferase